MGHQKHCVLIALKYSARMDSKPNLLHFHLQSAMFLLCLFQATGGVLGFGEERRELVEFGAQILAWSQEKHFTETNGLIVVMRRGEEACAIPAQDLLN